MDIKPIIKQESASASTSTPTPTYTFPEDDQEQFELPVEMQRNTWAVKIPRFLLERWESIPEAGVELGSLLVDTSFKPPRITMKLPSSFPMPSPELTPVGGESKRPSKRARYDTQNIPDEYEFMMPPEQVKNTYVFSEHERSWTGFIGGTGVVVKGESGSGGGVTFGKRKKEKAHPRLVSAVAHECTIRPVQSEKYNRILEQRRLESEQSKRPIIQLDSSNTSQRKLNQLASGFSNALSQFGSAMGDGRSRSNPERFARLDRPELLDRIFNLYSQRQYWGIPALRHTLKQPDAYLREILKEVAEMKTTGVYANMWELKEEWKQVKEERLEGGAGGPGGQGRLGGGNGDGSGMEGVKLELGLEEFEGLDDEEDFDEDDFEEVVS